MYLSRNKEKMKRNAFLLSYFQIDRHLVINFLAARWQHVSVSSMIQIKSRWLDNENRSTLPLHKPIVFDTGIY